MSDPKDVCWCGDYRENHKQGGSGPCAICEYAGPTRCSAFRLYETKDERENFPKKVKTPLRSL